MNFYVTPNYTLLTENNSVNNIESTAAYNEMDNEKKK